MFDKIKLFWKSTKEKDLQLYIQATVRKWELKELSLENIQKRLLSEVEYQVKEQVIAQVRHEIDQELVSKLAKELVEKHDLRKTMDEHLHERVKHYLKERT